MWLFCYAHVAQRGGMIVFHIWSCRLNVAAPAWVKNDLAVRRLDTMVCTIPGQEKQRGITSFVKFMILNFGFGRRDLVYLTE